MKTWEWCEELQNFCTPEARDLAHNVIHDLTVQIMERYQTAKRSNVVEKNELVVDNNEDEEMLLYSVPGKADEVQALSYRNNTNDGKSI